MPRGLIRPERLAPEEVPRGLKKEDQRTEKPNIDGSKLLELLQSRISSWIPNEIPLLVAQSNATDV